MPESTEKSAETTYRVEFDVPGIPESVDVRAGDIPDGMDVEEYVREKLELWEIGVRPGRWSGDEYDHVTVAASDKEAAEEAALGEHRNYSSVIDHSQALIVEEPEAVAVEEVGA